MRNRDILLEQKAWSEHIAMLRSTQLHYSTELGVPIVQDIKLHRDSNGIHLCLVIQSITFGVSGQCEKSEIDVWGRI